MSAATVTSSDHPADYLKEGMKWLEQHYIPDTTQRQDAGDCYSCLTPVPRGGEADNRRFCKRRLVSSSANMVGAKADDDLGTVANQHKYRMIAAQLMSNATREADQKTLNEKGLQCTNAYRLSGPLNDDGTCPIQNSTFVTKRSEDDDRYFLWTFDSEARLGKKIIGVPGLRDRLGLPPTPANITAWKKPTGDKISDFDAITNWIRSQIGQEQAFVQGDTDETTAYAGHAGRLRTALRLDSAGNQRAILRAKTTLWGSELNHPVIRQREKYDRKPPGGTFESLASRLVSLRSNLTPLKVRPWRNYVLNIPAGPGRSASPAN